MSPGDDQLVSFISRAREKGRNDEQIARSLASVGWKKDRIEAAFLAADEMKKGGAGQISEEPGKTEEYNAGAPEEQQKTEPGTPMGRVRLSTPVQPLRTPPQSAPEEPAARPQIIPPQRAAGVSPPSIPRERSQQPQHQPRATTVPPHHLLQSSPTLPPPLSP